MKHQKREISISAGTLVECSESGQVRLLGDVYVLAIREADGCWLYEGPGGQSCRCTGGLVGLVG